VYGRGWVDIPVAPLPAPQSWNFLVPFQARWRTLIRSVGSRVTDTGALSAEEAT